MKLGSVFIANRGEIAVRIARAASLLGLRSVAAFSADDANSMHVKAADAAVQLAGLGPSAYLDADAIIAAAVAANCDAIHPGYGFLSENAHFARACAQAGIIFVGPNVSALELFGDKGRAREAARQLGSPLLPGTAGATTLEEARAFMKSLGKGSAIMIKAIAGGGGRGMRAVTDARQLSEAYARCRSEAKAAFGTDEVYVEQFIARARHIEVQIIGDGVDVAHLWERECTLQRQNQKLIEIAPSPFLSSGVRDRLLQEAVRLASAASYDSLGTFEFLIDADAPERFAFMEANPRIQVEHTITEEVTGVDLVSAQLRLAAGATLSELNIGDASPPARFAIQARINLETMRDDGSARPTGGIIASYQAPSGPGVRVDGYGYAGYQTNPAFDSLLAKVIATGMDFPGALKRLDHALSEFQIEGPATNLTFLRALIARPELLAGDVDTRFVEANAAALARAESPTGRYVASAPAQAARTIRTIDFDDGWEMLLAPMQGRVAAIPVAVGSAVRPNETLIVIESMKMEHAIVAPQAGLVRLVEVKVGDTVFEGEPLIVVEACARGGEAETHEEAIDLEATREDLSEVTRLLALTRDEARPAAVERRRKAGKRTARENIDDLCDPGSFAEIGALVVPSSRNKPYDELLNTAPGDGVIAGFASINGAEFGAETARSIVMSYDYSVFAGTQGRGGHKKTDRVLDIARQAGAPFILFAEGGGGRLADNSQSATAAALDIPTFARFARLNGLAPTIGVTSGYCFAGNAALLGCCDVIIAAEGSNIGMGGPSMVEAGGLGAYKATDIGPFNVQKRNGVIDIAVKDEATGVAAAKQYLSYFQGSLKQWRAPDQRLLRRLVPQERVRAYDMRRVIDTLSDEASVLELRRDFGAALITTLVRIEGRPIGLIANNPKHLGGAIDADAADKAARFMQLCAAYGLPLIALVDTPGFMVGPAIEEKAQVRHVARMMIAASHFAPPYLSIILRKGYGLGALAMTAGGFHEPLLNVAWPTAEFGGANIEGMVRVAHRERLAAIEDVGERERAYQAIVEAAYAKGKAVNAASYHEIDAVIDPADTRRMIVTALASHRCRPPAQARPRVDTW